MKKLMFVAALAAAMTGWSDVSSANCVGYTTMTLQKDKFYIFATQFDETSKGTGDGIRICDLVTGEIPYGTEIQVMKMDKVSTQYDLYRFLAEVYDPEIDDFVADKWGDVGEELATRKLVPGTAFWIQPKDTFTASIAGQVLTEASKQVSFTAEKYTLFANPFPVAANPNAYTWTGLTYGDEIQVLKTDKVSTQYDLYRYLAEVYDPSIDDFVTDKWGDVGEELIRTGIIPVGQGAWIKTAKAVTLDWTSPIQ